MKIRSMVLTFASLVMAAWIAGSVLAIGRQSTVEAATIGDRDAAALAIMYAQRGGPGLGQLSSAPSMVWSKPMAYGAAWQYVMGRELIPSPVAGREPERPTWVVVIRGEITRAALPGRDGTSTAPQRSEQMAVILDAATGELFNISIRAPGQELSTSGLASVALPIEPAKEVPPPSRRSWGIPSVPGPRTVGTPAPASSPVSR